MRWIVRLLQAVLLALVFAGTAAAGAPSSELVDINSADVETLDRVLANIGPTKAQAIVAYRRAHGPFRSVDQLALVKGIGLKTIERNRDRIVLGTLPSTPQRQRTAGPRVPASARGLSG